MSFLELIKAEFKAILTNPTIFITVIFGAIFYSFLYPQPYINQTPREQKVVLIDLDGTPLSRKLARMINSTPQIHLSKQVYSIDEAKQAIQEAKALGYLLIPKNFAKNIKLQKSPTLVYGANASYFLVYGSIVEGIYNASSAISSEILISKEYFNKPPLKLDSKPAFNLTSGYLNYVIPAVFILIFHQIMLIGAGLQGATQTEQKEGYWLNVSPLKLILARILVYLVVYLPIGLYYMGFSFSYYDVPHLAHIDILLLFTIPFVVSATSLGILLGEIIPRRELITFFVLVSSLPLVFTGGFVWPTSSITPWLNSLVQWFPTTPTVMSLLKLNQMGAHFSQVADKWFQICFLAIFYFLSSWLIMRKKRGKLDYKAT